MGPAIDALRPALRATGRHPRFLALALGGLAATAAGSWLAGRLPVVGQLANSLLVAPAVAALLLGAAAAALGGEGTSIGAGVERLRASYRTLVLAYAALIVGVVAIALAWAVEVAVVLVVDGGVAVGGRGGAAAAALEPAALAANGPVLALTLLALAVALVGGLAIQFFDVAIVVGGESALGSFGASWRLFRTAPASVLGYSALRLTPVGLAVAAAIGTNELARRAAGQLAGLAAAALVAAVVGPVVYGFATAYHVAYYDARVDGAIAAGAADPGEEPTHAGDVAPAHSTRSLE